MRLEKENRGEMKKIYYSETQSMKMLVFILISIGVFVLLAGIFQWGSKPAPLGLTIFIFLLLAGLTLPFYQLSIKICESHARIRFGIGWLKRKIAIDNLDLSDIQIIDLPWYAGIGYRISSEGSFFNTKPGPAVLIKTKDGSPPFFVGTDKYEEIIRVLHQLQKS